MFSETRFWESFHPVKVVLFCGENFLKIRVFVLFRCPHSINNDDSIQHKSLVYHRFGRRTSAITTVEFVLWRDCETSGGVNTGDSLEKRLVLIVVSTILICLFLFFTVVEGVTLKELNISAYSGDTFHESPVFLLFYQLLVNNLGDLQIFIVFILFDIVTAFLISKICADQLRCMSVVEKRRISGDEEFDEKDVRSLMIQANTIDQLAFWSLAIYCLSPYSILACVGQSTSIFINFLLALTIFLATHGQRFISLTLLSLLTLNSFYPLILLLPLIMILEQKFQINRKEATFTIDFQSRPTKISIGFSFILFIFLYSSWFSLSLFLEDWSFQFVHSIYVFM